MASELDLNKSEEIGINCKEVAKSVEKLEEMESFHKIDNVPSVLPEILENADQQQLEDVKQEVLQQNEENINILNSKSEQNNLVIVQSQEMMENEIIQQDHNCSLGTDEQLKHISNPQEESYEEDISIARSQEMKGEVQQESDPKESNQDATLSPSSQLYQPELPLNNSLVQKTQSTRNKDRKERKKSTGSNQGETKTKNGRWSLMEHVRFLEALKNFGKNWKKVEEYVATRTSTQARSHAQKFFANIVKKNMTMEQFLDLVSQETLNQLRRIAQQSQDSKVNTEMGDAEVMKLVMMHMSKGYHQEEIELLKDMTPPMSQAVDQTASSSLINKKETTKRKRLPSKQIQQLEEETIKNSEPNQEEQKNDEVSMQDQDAEMTVPTCKQRNDPISTASTAFQSSGEIVHQDTFYEQNSLIGNDQLNPKIRDSSKFTQQFVDFDHDQIVSHHHDILDNHTPTNHLQFQTLHQPQVFNYAQGFSDLHNHHQISSNVHHQQQHDIDVFQGRCSILSSSNLIDQHTPNHNNTSLPFMHLGDNTPANLSGKFEMFSFRNQRASQDFMCISSTNINGVNGIGVVGNGGAVTIRSSRASSFDFNDCISKENHTIEEIVGGSYSKVPICYSQFKKNHH